MRYISDDPQWKARWEEGFRAGYAAQEVDCRFTLAQASADELLWTAVWELSQQYTRPEFASSDVLYGLQRTLAYLRQRELERPELEAQLETYRQLALTLQRRLDEQNKPSK